MDFDSFSLLDIDADEHAEYWTIHYLSGSNSSHTKTIHRMTIRLSANLNGMRVTEITEASHEMSNKFLETSANFSFAKYDASVLVLSMLT